MEKLTEQKQQVFSSKVQKLVKRLETPNLKESTQAFLIVVLQTPIKK